MRMRTPGACLALTVAGALCAGVAAPAHAGREGRRNTAIGLGAVAIYGAVKKKPVLAGAAGGAAIYSYVRSQQSSPRRKPTRRVVVRRSSRRCWCGHPAAHSRHRHWTAAKRK